MLGLMVNKIEDVVIKESYRNFENFDFNLFNRNKTQGSNAKASIQTYKKVLNKSKGGKNLLLKEHRLYIFCYILKINNICKYQRIQ